MPISTTCSACQARLTVPDAAISKRVKCKNCQNVFQVVAPTSEAGDSDFEIVSPPPPPAAKPSRTAKPPVPVPAPMADAILDDDGDDEPAPKAKAKRRRSDDDEDELPKKSNLLKILLIVGGVLFLLAVIAVIAIVAMVYFAAKEVKKDLDNLPNGPNSTSPVGEPPAIAVNWVPFDNPTTKYATSFPGGKPTKLDPLADITDPEQRKLAQSMSKGATSDAYGLTVSGWRYLVNAVVYSASSAVPRDPSQVIGFMETFATQLYKNAKVGPSKSLLVNGHLAKDFVITQDNRPILVRYVVLKEAVYSIRVEGDPSMSEDDGTAREFLEKFVPKAAKGSYTEEDIGGAPAKKPKAKK